MTETSEAVGSQLPNTAEPARDELARKVPAPVSTLEHSSDRPPIAFASALAMTALGVVAAAAIYLIFQYLLFATQLAGVGILREVRWVGPMRWAASASATRDVDEAVKFWARICIPGALLQGACLGAVGLAARRGPRLSWLLPACALAVSIAVSLAFGGLVTDYLENAFAAHARALVAPLDADPGGAATSLAKCISSLLNLSAFTMMANTPQACMAAVVWRLTIASWADSGVAPERHSPRNIWLEAGALGVGIAIACVGAIATMIGIIKSFGVIAQTAPSEKAVALDAALAEASRTLEGVLWLSLTVLAVATSFSVVTCLRARANPARPAMRGPLIALRGVALFGFVGAGLLVHAALPYRWENVHSFAAVGPPVQLAYARPEMSLAGPDLIARAPSLAIGRGWATLDDVRLETVDGALTRALPAASEARDTLTIICDAHATREDTAYWLYGARQAGIAHVQFIVRTWRREERPVMGTVSVAAFSAASAHLLRPGAASAGEKAAEDIMLNVDAVDSCEGLARQAADARNAGRTVAL